MNVCLGRSFLGVVAAERFGSSKNEGWFVEVKMFIGGNVWVLNVGADVVRCCVCINEGAL